eukprot:TRINITY_DN55003_c0_g1_i1.p1 TRINITY_DN55003_c0_g1~~TRINITY_DN55003_c0_g1_i1.p1  ORF type:complete len:724 (-),score=105.04 TRINITY_DN55003_c0_g1_i1:139-2310(-)
MPSQINAASFLLEMPLPGLHMRDVDTHQVVSSCIEANSCEKTELTWSIVSRIDDVLKQRHDSLETMVERRLALQEELLVRLLHEHSGHIVAEQPVYSTETIRISQTETLPFNQSSPRNTVSDAANAFRRSTYAEDFDRQEFKKQVKLRSQIDAEPSEENSDAGVQDTVSKRKQAGPLAKRLLKFVHGNHFNMVCAWLIIGNAAFLGVQLEMSADRVKGIVDGENFSRHEAFPVVCVSITFVVCFLIELVLRISAEGREFLTSKDSFWNVLDLFVNGCSVVEVLIQLIWDRDQATMPNMGILRILRAVRICRIFRVVRVVRAFRQLRILVGAIVSTLRCGGWTMLLLLGIIYVFSIVFMAGVVDFAEEAADYHCVEVLMNDFGSVLATVSTLFQAIVGGIDWGSVLEGLKCVGPAYVVLFHFYIAVTSMIVLNVVNGIFVQSAIESAQCDSEQVLAHQIAEKHLYVERMKELFREIDPENSGSISLERLEAILEEPVVKSYFTMLELDLADAWTLFKLLDTTECGSVSLDNFADGCLRLRGGARRIDISNMMYSSKWTMSKLSNFATQAHADTALIVTLLEDVLKNQNILGNCQSRLSEVIARKSTCKTGGVQLVPNGLSISPRRSGARDDVLSSQASTDTVRHYHSDVMVQPVPEHGDEMAHTPVGEVDCKVNGEPLLGSPWQKDMMDAVLARSRTYENSTYVSDTADMQLCRSRWSTRFPGL